MECSVPLVNIDAREWQAVNVASYFGLVSVISVAEGSPLRPGILTPCHGNVPRGKIKPLVAGKMNQLDAKGVKCILHDGDKR